MCIRTDGGFRPLRDFQVLQELGRGSYGVVFKARCQVDGQLRALKRLHARLGQKDRERAMQEVRLLRDIHHPNIIGCYGSFMCESMFYLVLEYADGGDLQQFMHAAQRRDGPVSEATLWKFCLEISYALRYLHQECHVVHRDLKLLNVFLSSPDRTVKVGDLGVSKLCESCGFGELTQSRVGTPLYLSPEQVKRQTYGFKVDVWALGVLLYTLTALEAPFNGTNLIALGYNIVKKRPKPLPKRYSAQWRGLLDRLLAKRQDERPTIVTVLDTLIQPSVHAKYGRRDAGSYEARRGGTPYSQSAEPPSSQQGIDTSEIQGNRIETCFSPEVVAEPTGVARHLRRPASAVARVSASTAQQHQDQRPAPATAEASPEANGQTRVNPGGFNAAENQGARPQWNIHEQTAGVARQERQPVERARPQSAGGARRPQYAAFMNAEQHLNQNSQFHPNCRPSSAQSVRQPAPQSSGARGFAHPDPPGSVVADAGNRAQEAFGVEGPNQSPSPLPSQKSGVKMHQRPLSAQPRVLRPTAAGPGLPVNVTVSNREKNTEENSYRNKEKNTEENSKAASKQRSEAPIPKQVSKATAPAPVPKQTTAASSPASETAPLTGSTGSAPSTGAASSPGPVTGSPARADRIRATGAEGVYSSSCEGSSENSWLDDPRTRATQVARQIGSNERSEASKTTDRKPPKRPWSATPQVLSGPPRPGTTKTSALWGTRTEIAAKSFCNAEKSAAPGKDSKSASDPQPSQGKTAEGYPCTAAPLKGGHWLPMAEGYPPKCKAPATTVQLVKPNQAKNRPSVKDLEKSLT